MDSRPRFFDALTAKMGGKARSLGLGVIGLFILLQLDPCGAETGGCGPEPVSDGVQSCEEWTRRSTLSGGDSEVGAQQVELAGYLQQLESAGVSVPTSTPAGASDRLIAPTSEESIERMEAYVLAHAAQSDAEESVEVVLDLGELPFPELRDLQTMDSASRRRVLSDRKALIEREQESIQAYLHQLGVRTSRPVGLLNHLQAWVPPHAMPDVAALPDVKAIYPAWQPVELLYDHEELRQATFLSEFWELDIKGEFGSQSCDGATGYEDIKIAVVEGAIATMFFPNRVNSVHPGWQDCEFASCESRIRVQLDCYAAEGDDLDACLPSSGAPQELGNHGTWVASIAAGDITQGQDPNTTDPDVRRRRTGIAPEASILYFTAGSTGFVAAAVMQAFVLGADVINLSIAVTECAFALEANCGGLNQVIRTVTKGGTLVVAAAGNENPHGHCEPSPGCNVCYPAIRPEVLSVANVETTSGIDYDEADIATSSSRGWARVGISGRHAALYPQGVDIPVVSIAAPGNLCSYFGSKDAYVEAGQSGTSFAAPVVSAAAGLIREEFGIAVRDARMLRSHILAMGDASGAETPDPGVAVGTSNLWGTGRAKFHAFDAMQGPKALAHRSFEIRENEQVSFYAANTSGDAFEPEVTQWKMGMYIDSPDLGTIPYLLVTYWNTCNRPHLIAADLEPALDRHAVFESPAVDEACLEIRVYGYSVPAGGVEVFVTDYYHAGDPTEH